MSIKDKEWDAIMQSHDEALAKGQEVALTGLIYAIDVMKFTEVCQVEDYIKARLTAIKANQYEAEAKADYITEQTPNV